MEGLKEGKVDGFEELDGRNEGSPVTSVVGACDGGKDCVGEAVG